MEEKEYEENGGEEQDHYSLRKGYFYFYLESFPFHKER